MAVTFSDIAEVISGLSKQWTEQIARLAAAEGHDGVVLDMDAVIPRSDYTLKDIEAKLISSLSIVGALKNVEHDAPVPSRFLTSLRDCANKLADVMQELETDLNNVDSNGGVNGVNATDWVLIAAQNNISVPVGDRLRKIMNAADELLIAYYQIAQIVSTAGYESFAGAADELANLLNDARQRVAAIVGSQKSVEEYEVRTRASEKAVSDVAQAISEIKDQVNVLNEEIIKNRDQSNTTLSDVDAIKQKADTLKTEVEGYQKDFTAFQQQLDGRNKAYEKSMSETDVLLKTHQDHNEKISKQIEEAGKLLVGATNVALASAFNDTVAELDTKLKAAKTSFSWSIFFLAASVVPLITFVMFGKTELTYQIAAGFLLLIAAPGWLAKVNGGRYQNLFVLREHYKHKYVLAMSVPGFKEQVSDEEAQKAIAGAVFEQVSFNPTDSVNDQGADQHPSPLMNWVIEKFGISKK